MGDGEGKKDVSEEIEDEEQLLGLKDQPPPPDADKPDAQKPKPDPVDNKTGKEMSTDFDGEMHDLAPEEQEQDDDQPDDDEADFSLATEADHGGVVPDIEADALRIGGDPWIAGRAVELGEQGTCR